VWLSSSGAKTMSFMAIASAWVCLVAKWQVATGAATCELIHPYSPMA
jgi:hypothetical protein